jgi:hypothetical protein
MKILLIFKKVLSWMLYALCRRVWCTRDAHKAKEGKEIKPHEMVIVVNGFRDSDDEDLHRYISY